MSSAGSWRSLWTQESQDLHSKTQKHNQACTLANHPLYSIAKKTNVVGECVRPGSLAPRPRPKFAAMSPRPVRCVQGCAKEKKGKKQLVTQNVSDIHCRNSGLNRKLESTWPWGFLFQWLGLRNILDSTDFLSQTSVAHQSYSALQ